MFGIAEHNKKNASISEINEHRYIDEILEPVF